MAELVNPHRTGFSLTCMDLEPTAPEFVILSMSILHSGKILFEADSSEWRSVHINELNRLVNGILGNAMKRHWFSLRPRMPEFKYRHDPYGRVTFSVDVDRDSKFNLSGNFLTVDFESEWEDIMRFAEQLGDEIDEMEERLIQTQSREGV